MFICLVEFLAEIAQNETRQARLGYLIFVNPTLIRDHKKAQMLTKICTDGESNPGLQQWSGHSFQSITGEPKESQLSIGKFKSFAYSYLTQTQTFPFFKQLICSRDK